MGDSVKCKHTPGSCQLLLLVISVFLPKKLRQYTGRGSGWHCSPALFGAGVLNNVKPSTVGNRKVCSAFIAVDVLLCLRLLYKGEVVRH